MTARVLSLVNLKGGVGKTALAVNVSVAMAAEYGHKVLLVDLDPQSNASVWLMGVREWVERANHQRTKTVYGLLCRNEPISECLIRSPVRDEHGKVLVEKLDLIPATHHLMLWEEGLHPPEGRPPWYVQFLRHMRALADSYDYIVIDCPPNIYKATKCAIFAADRVVVPCNHDALSWVGLDLLAKRIFVFCGMTQADFDAERPGQPLPLVGGIIMNNVHTTHQRAVRLAQTNLTRRIETLKQEGFTTSDAEILPVTVRNAAALEAGTFQFRPLLYADSRNETLLEDYRNVANFFVNTLLR